MFNNWWVLQNDDYTLSDKNDDSLQLFRNDKVIQTQRKTLARNLLDLVDKCGLFNFDKYRFGAEMILEAALSLSLYKIINLIHNFPCTCLLIHNFHVPIFKRSFCTQ